MTTLPKTNHKSQVTGSRLQPREPFNVAYLELARRFTLSNGKVFINYLHISIEG